jgi:hypothetical protein
VYPLLALLAAAGLVVTARTMGAHYHRPLPPAARLAAVLLVAALPYGILVQQTRRLTNTAWHHSSLLYGHHLRAQARQLPHLREYLLGDDGEFNDSPEFYMAALTRQYGHRITRVAPWDAGWVNPPRVVATCGARARQAWDRHYRTRSLFRTDSCATFYLEARR